jgi:hypothetical protein
MAAVSSIDSSVRKHPVADLQSVAPGGPVLGRWALAEADGLIDAPGLAEPGIAVRLDGLPAEVPTAVPKRTADQVARSVVWRSAPRGTTLQHDTAARAVRTVAEADDREQSLSRIAQSEPQPGIAAGAERLVAQDELARLAAANQFDGAASQLVRAGAMGRHAAPSRAVPTARALALNRSAAAVPGAALA